MRNFKHALLAASIVLAQPSFSQTIYKMQPVTIQTRWAPEVKPADVHKEYPRPQLVRKNWINLNGLWDYSVTQNNTGMPATYEGKILVPFPVESALSGVKRSVQPEEIIWYRRILKQPKVSDGDRVMLNFGAVNWEATVFVNGKQAAHHTGGYTSFSVDITTFLVSGDNELIVKVSNPLEKGIGPRGKQTLTPGAIWYTPSSGIWQTAWLETVPENYVQQIQVNTDVNHSKAIITVVSPRESEVRLQVAGKTLSGLSNSPIVVDLGGARLWSPDDPFLYNVTAQLGNDIVESYFGMRKVEIKRDKDGYDRIFLNNRYTYNLGTLDQGFWPDGLYTAPGDAALKYDIQSIKAMGFNTIRKHIKVEPARWYYHADKLGILVWQDLVQPATQGGKPPVDEAKKQFEKESAEMIAQLKCFPSIIAWVVFNEGWGAYDQGRITEWVKKQDISRLVNGHSGAAIVDGKVDLPAEEAITMKSVNSDMTDVHSYPPPALPSRMDGKVMVLGEFGGIGTSVYDHVWDDIVAGWGYGGSVSGGVMKSRYKIMVDSLKRLEKIGLSASIYTQPFDVEAEQNGLMTYDREMIKIPFAELRQIHKQLWPATKNYQSVAQVTAKNIDTGLVNYQQLLAAYKNGRKDSASLRKLALVARRNKDKASAIKFAEEYISVIRDTFYERNIRFIHSFAQQTTDKCFAILFNNMAKANKVLGKDNAEAKITGIIEADEILPYTKDSVPDWKSIESKVVAKYGDIGREIVWQSKVLHSINNQKWDVYQEILVAWFERYGYKRQWIGAGLLNNLAWAAFEHINDKTIIERVAKMTAHALQLEADANLLDTHANLVYKIGQKEEALRWQEKAVAAAPDNEAIRSNLEKMKNGQQTWPN